MRVSCASLAVSTGPGSASNACSRTTAAPVNPAPASKADALSASDSNLTYYLRQEKTMGQYVAPIRDMQFVLHEFLNVAEEFKGMPNYAEVDADIINQVLEEGAKFTQDVLFPLNHS